MKKNILIIIFIFALFVFPIKANAKTLRDLKNELQELENKKAAQDNEKQKTDKHWRSR